MYQNKTNLFVLQIFPDDAPIYDYTDSLPNEKPEFPGGEESFFKFLHNNLCYPTILVDLEIEGKVIVEFIIETDGSINNIQIIESTHPEFSKEVIRVMKLMPRWKPGKVNGKTVRVKYDVTVAFSLGQKIKPIYKKTK